MCYTYDNLSRVTKRIIRDLNDEVLSRETFTYDAAGNIICGTADSAFEYDTNNRLISYDENDVSYDLDGNMLSNGEIVCSYDSANRLITAGGCTYTYNAENIRIRNLCTSEDTTYTYDTNCKLSRLLVKTTNGFTTKYVYGRGLIGEEVGGAFKTYHFDYRGSTVAITDVGGNITDTFAYDTYGKLISRTGDSDVIFGYNGRDGVITDSNGLIYMRARYYSPEMRRFVNADILAGTISDSTSLNRYSYVNGNPVSMVDPFGLSAERGNTLLETNNDNIHYILYIIYRVYYNVTKFHFEDRLEKNGVHPTYSQVVEGNSGWTLLPREDSIYHDNGYGKAELKFVHDDGREAVFDGDTLQPMTDPRYIATYNYGVYKPLPDNPNFEDYIDFAIGGITHGIMDVLPYWLTGYSNTREQFEDKVKNKVSNILSSVEEIACSALNSIEEFIDLVSNKIPLFE